MMHETSLSYSTKRSLQQGFTLLELVLVLFLIGLLASAGLLFTDNIESQAKYEETQKRIALIKRAIVGDLTRTVNGGPELSGFVSDVGRLPLCLKELVELGPQVGATNDYESSCGTATEFYLRLWNVDPATGIGAGWRGPYLQAAVESDGERRFRDGYGNGNDPDDHNFGWYWQLASSKSDVDAIDLSSALSAVNAEYIHLQSDGFDIGLAEDDVPVDGNDFLIALDWLFSDGDFEQATIPLRFSIDQPLSAQITIESYLERNEVNSSFLTASLSNPPDTEISFAASSVGVYQKQVVFNRALPMGRFIFRLDCPVSCVPDNYLITILPRQTLAPLEFRIIP